MPSTKQETLPYFLGRKWMKFFDFIKFNCQTLFKKLSLRPNWKGSRSLLFQHWEPTFTRHDRARNLYWQFNFSIFHRVKFPHPDPPAMTSFVDRWNDRIMAPVPIFKNCAAPISVRKYFIGPMTSNVLNGREASFFADF